VSVAQTPPDPWGAMVPVLAFVVSACTGISAVICLQGVCLLYNELKVFTAGSVVRV
jgi:hypothetical protein